MGIDVHAVNFLKKVNERQSLGNTITLGRQGIHFSRQMAMSLVNAGSDYVVEPYCEGFLCKFLGASSVESIDNSSYESATHIHDMNRPLPDALVGRYDTVFDGGCLEHIFDVVQAFRNCSMLCRPGGQIVHILPSNNFCGHGFWQFSPELFFSLYSVENGYRDTEVYLAGVADYGNWYKVVAPTGGKRVNVFTSSELYVMVRTVVANQTFSHAKVQQSDYVYQWEEGEVVADEAPAAPAGLREYVGALKPVRQLLSPLYRRYRRWSEGTGLSSRNPGLIHVRVD